VRPEGVRATTQTRDHRTELDEYVRKMPSENDFGSVVVEKNKNKNRNFSGPDFLKFLENAGFSGFGANLGF